MKKFEKLFILCRNRFNQNHRKTQTKTSIYDGIDTLKWFQDYVETVEKNQNIPNQADLIARNSDMLIINSLEGGQSVAPISNFPEFYEQKRVNERLMNNAELPEDYDHIRNDRVRFMVKMVHLYLPEIFPNQQRVDQLTKTVWNFTSKQFAEKNYDHEHLLFHVNDYEWLRKYITSTIRRKDPKQRIYADEVVEFMQEPMFMNAHDNFEQRVVKSHIRKYMRQVSLFREGNIFYELHKGDFEKYVHHSVICAGDILGLNRQAVVRGLQENERMWKHSPRGKKLDDGGHTDDGHTK